jgi:ribosome-binding protein aMBF1 (putative translation factor)
MSAENKISDPVASAARAAMVERGISARKLAQRLAMRPETVLDFVLQRRETRPSTRLSICRELGVNHEQSFASA